MNSCCCIAILSTIICNAFAINIPSITLVGNISSIDFPSYYLPFELRVNHIEVDSDYRICLQFTHVRLGANENDYIVVFDGPDCMAPRLTVVHSDNQGDIYSTDNRVTTLFLSDKKGDGDGYFAQYYKIPKNDMPDQVEQATSGLLTHMLEPCGEERFGEGKIVIAYPEGFSLLCIWRITMNERSRIKFDINIREEHKRGHDLRIMDGEKCSNVQIYRYRKKDALKHMKVSTSGNKAVVLFKRPRNAKVFKGFIIQYTEIVPKTTTARTTTTKLITTTTQPFVNSCRGHMPHSKHLVLEFYTSIPQNEKMPFQEKRIEIKEDLPIMAAICEVNFPRSATNFIILFDGPDCMADRVGIASESNEETFFTTGKYLTILFVGQNNLGGESFRAIYKATENAVAREPVEKGGMLINCGSDITDTRQVIVTPNAPRYELLCIWRITVPNGMVIVLSVNSFGRVHEGKWLRILNGPSCDGRPLLLLDQTVPESTNPVWTTGDQALVVYYQPYHRKGVHVFKINITAAEPGASIQKSEVVIENQKSHGVKCMLPYILWWKVILLFLAV